MPRELTSHEKQLIQRSLITLDHASQKILFDLLTKQVERDNLFFTRLIPLVKLGLTFVAHSLKDNTDFLYDSRARQVKVNLQYIKNVVSKAPLCLSFILRHEIARAFHFALSEESEAAAKKALFKYATLAIDLYRQLSCIEQTHRVNTTTLDRLSSVLHQVENIQGQPIEITTPHLDDIEFLIRHRGSYRELNKESDY